MTRWRSSTDRARCGLPRRDGDGGTSLSAVTSSSRHPHLAPPGAHHEDAVVVGDELADRVGEGRPGQRVGRAEPVPHDDPRTDPRVTTRPDLRCVHGPHSMCAMTYVIAQPCVDLKDKACIEECPVDCIYEGERSLYIHPDECVDCGACEPVCPVEAIYYEDDVPEQWAEYYKANVEFFDDLGSPGGAAKIGRHPQGPPDHRRPAAAGARRVRCSGSPTSPGTRSLRPRSGRVPFPTRRSARRARAWSTCRSARPSTRRPPSCARRWPRRPTRTATR